MSVSTKLGPGATFPTMKLSCVGGQEVVLPDDIDTPFAIALFYRGHW